MFLDVYQLHRCRWTSSAPTGSSQWGDRTEPYFFSVTIIHAQNVTEKPMRTVFPSWCPQNDPRGSSLSWARSSEPAKSITWAFVRAEAITRPLPKVSSDWLLLGWHLGRSVQRRVQAASTELLRLPESPAKPGLPSADDPGNMRVQSKSLSIPSLNNPHQQPPSLNNQQL